MLEPKHSKKWILMGLMLALLLLLTACLPGTLITTKGEKAGFFLGIWHGWMVVRLWFLHSHHQWLWRYLTGKKKAKGENLQIPVKVCKNSLSPLFHPAITLHYA